MLHEGGIVRTGTQCSDREVARQIGRDLGHFPCFVVCTGRSTGDLHPRTRPRRNRDAGLWIGDIGRDAIDHMLQRVAALHMEKAPPVAVGIDINQRFLFQLRRMRLSPLGGTE